MMKKILNTTKGLLFLIIIFSIAMLMVAADDAQLSATLLTQTPDPASSGDTVDLRIKVTNEGGKISPQVVGEIIPEFPFTLTYGQVAQQIIGELPNYPTEANYKILTYKIKISKDAIDKNYDLKFRYSDDGGISWVVDTFNVRVTSNKYAQIISLDKVKINPGEETPLIFTINNIGKSPLNNLVFTWSEEDNVILPVGTDNTRYVSYLGIGERQELVFNVVANPTATRGLYTLNLKLTFDAMNSSSSSVQSTKIETNAGVLIGGSTDFEVSLADSTTGTTSISIANIGSNPATSVTVSIPEQTGWKVSGSSSSIIGNLNQGDYTIASFNLQAGSGISQNTPTKGDSSQMNLSRSQNNELKIKIAYTDTMGNREIIEKNVPVSAQSLIGNVTGMPGRNATPQSGFFARYWYVWVLILVVLAYWGYKRYKKILSEKPNFKWKDLRWKDFCPRKNTALKTK